MQISLVYFNGATKIDIALGESKDDLSFCVDIPSDVIVRCVAFYPYLREIRLYASKCHSQEEKNELTPQN